MCGQVRPQFSDDPRFRIQVKRRRTRNHLQRRWQVEAQLLQAVRVVGPVQAQRPGRARPQRQFNQSVEIQPAGAQRQAQQKGSGFAAEIDRLVVEVAAAGLEG